MWAGTRTGWTHLGDVARRVLRDLRRLLAQLAFCGEGLLVLGQAGPLREVCLGEGDASSCSQLRSRSITTYTNLGEGGVRYSVHRKSPVVQRIAQPEVRRDLPPVELVVPALLVYA